MDTPTIKCKWLEVYFGLFGPRFTYHTSGYDDENARLVISLLFCHLYITLPWCHKVNTHDFYAVYGLYSAEEPDRFIWAWGDYYKMILMPWARIVTERMLYSVDDYPADLIRPDETLEDIKVKVDTYPYMYIWSATCYGREVDYFIIQVTSYPKMFRKLKWFGKTYYTVHVLFDKPFAGYSTMTFNTYSEDTRFIKDQIALTMMMKEEFYTDF